MNYKYFIVHCAATKPSMDIDWTWIDRVHKKRGWSGIGYNFFIKRDGTIQEGRPLGTVGAHTIGRNHDGIGVCFAGGIDENGKGEDNVTVDQMRSILSLFEQMKEKFPGLRIAGHKDFNRTGCPNLSIQDYARKHGIKEEDIW